MLLIGCVVLIATARTFFPDLAAAALTLSILAAMTWHLFDYEKGRDRAATDFAVTTAGIVYLGWIGAYLIDLRTMPEWIVVAADRPSHHLAGRYGGLFRGQSALGNTLSAHGSARKKPGRAIGRVLFSVRSVRSGW